MGIDELIRDVTSRARSDDPLDRLATAAGYQQELVVQLDELLDHFVQAARQAGCSWTEIGDVLGVTRQAAQQRHRGGPRPGKGGRGLFRRFSPAAKSAVVDAQRAARALGHEAIGTEHVLLGLLARDDDLAARLLAGWGVERADVERDVVARHAEAPSGGSEGPRRRVGRGGRSARDGDDAAGDRPHRRSRHHIPFTRPAKKTLELALRESMALGNAYIGAEHVLLGLLRADDIAAELLAARGVTYDRVHAALGETVGDGPTGD